MIFLSLRLLLERLLLAAFDVAIDVVVVGIGDAVVVEVADDVGTGFVMVGEDGRVQVDGTLETRLHRLAPTLAIEIYGQLEER